MKPEYFCDLQYQPVVDCSQRRRASRDDVEQDTGWPCDCGHTTTPPYCDGFSHAE